MFRAFLGMLLKPNKKNILALTGCIYILYGLKHPSLLLEVEEKVCLLRNVFSIDLFGTINLQSNLDTIK